MRGTLHPDVSLGQSQQTAPRMGKTSNKTKSKFIFIKSPTFRGDHQRTLSGVPYVVYGSNNPRPKIAASSRDAIRPMIIFLVFWLPLLSVHFFLIVE
jgi:hypothetical protein